MLFLLIISVYQLLKFSDNKLHLIFCNVGQGDGILIRTPNGNDIIIDGGPDDKMLGCLANHLPLLDKDIEAMYLTHPDADHLAGLISVLKTYSVKYFGTSKAPKDTEVFKELTKTLQEKKIPVHYIFKGDAVKTQDGFYMKAFWPTHQFVESGGNIDVNYYSLIQEISYKKFSALITGDSPYQVLDPIMSQIDILDVFKPPHHGSKTGVDGSTFQHLVPKFAVLSFGFNNRYHHPAPSTLQILNSYHIPYKNTLKGDIEVVTDGKSWSVR